MQRSRQVSFGSGVSFGHSAPEDSYRVQQDTLPGNDDHDQASIGQPDSTSLTSQMQGGTFGMTPSDGGDNNAPRKSNQPPAHGYSTLGGQRLARYSNGQGGGRRLMNTEPAGQTITSFRPDSMFH